MQEKTVSFNKTGVIFKKRISQENNSYFNIRSLLFLSDMIGDNGQIIDTNINMNLAIGVYPSPLSKYYTSGFLLNIDDCIALARMFNDFKLGKIPEIVYMKDSKIFKGDSQVVEVITLGIQKGKHPGTFWCRIGSFNRQTQQHYDYYDFQLYASELIRIYNIINTFDHMYNRIYFQISADLALQELRGNVLSSNNTNQSVNYASSNSFYGDSEYRTQNVRNVDPYTAQNNSEAKNTETLQQYNQQYNADCDVTGPVAQPNESTTDDNIVGAIDFASNINNFNTTNDDQYNQTDEYVANTNNYSDTVDEQYYQSQQPANSEPIISENNIQMPCAANSEPIDNTSDNIMQEPANSEPIISENNIQMPCVANSEPIDNIINDVNNIMQEPANSEPIDNTSDNMSTQLNQQYVYDQQTIDLLNNIKECEQIQSNKGVLYKIDQVSTHQSDFDTLMQLCSNIGNYGITKFTFTGVMYFYVVLHITQLHTKLKGKIETNDMINSSDFDMYELKGLYLILLNWLKLTTRIKGDDVVFSTNEIEIGERIILMLENYINDEQLRSDCYDRMFLKDVT